MPINFRCSQCDQLLRVPDTAAGKSARCPKCQALMAVPPLGSNELAPPSEAQPSAAQSVEAARQQTTLEALPKAADKPPTHAATSDGTNPFGPQTPGQPPAPLLPRPHELWQHPEQLPNAHPPAGGNPFGDTAEHLSSAAARPVVSSTNPYATPAFAATDAVFALAGQHRIGLPWENERRTLGCWFRTVGQVLGSPSYAFSVMHQSGGLGIPIQFNAYGITLPIVVIAALVVSLLSILALVEGIDGAATLGMTALVGLVILGTLLFYIAIYATVGQMLIAALFHIPLMLFGGSRHGYETTFRVLSYSYSSLLWLVLIPYLGSCILLVWLPIVLIIGLCKAHEISAGRSILVVLATFVGCAGAYAGILGLMSLLDSSL